MTPHKRRPPPIGAIEKRQIPSMRIRPTRAHKDAFDLAPLLQVVGEGGFHAGV